MPSAAGTVIWPLVDNQGTDRDLVEYNAATGVTSVVDHITYSGFGAVTSETNAAVDYLSATPASSATLPPGSIKASRVNMTH